MVVATTDELKMLSQSLEATFSPDRAQRKQAEDFLLNQERTSIGYPIALLQIVGDETAQAPSRLAAAVQFKNYSKKYWDEDILPDDRRELVRSNLVKLMLSVPDNCRKQLSSAIGFIAAIDFPDRWPTLLDTFLEYIGQGHQQKNYAVIVGILETAHSIFKRYRGAQRSDHLWSEIKLVLDKFAQPLLELLKSLWEALKTNQDAQTLVVQYQAITIVTKLILDLTWQELPDQFADTLEQWLTIFHDLLSFVNPALNSDSDEEAGLIEIERSVICDIISMLALKYDDDFSPYLPKFVQDIWTLLTTVGQQMKYDILVSKAIQVLRSVVERPNYRNLFEGEESLKLICEQVVGPNMMFRDADMELFEDNPDEYIRRDIEGSDAETRRRAAHDLARSLCSAFGDTATKVFLASVDALLAQAKTDIANNWPSKNTALFLFTAVAVKSKITAARGAQEIDPSVNIGQFMQQNILEDLQATDLNRLPVLHADALKFLTTFRNQLDSNSIISVLPMISKFLRSPHAVVASYAAYAVERLCTVRDAQTGEFKITQDALTAAIGPILEELLTVLPKSKENEFVMKCIMRLLSRAKPEDSLPLIEKTMGALMAELEKVCKNPAKPRFNHYLFETLTVITQTVRGNFPNLLPQIQSALFPSFEFIIAQDITEFTPYAFQILAVLLAGADGIPDAFMGLFGHILSPQFWERSGNVPALVDLLTRFLEKNNPQLLADESKLTAVLGIFQRLHASKALDHEGFKVIFSLIEHVPVERLNKYLPEIFSLGFRRLSGKSRTPKHTSNFIVLQCLVAGKFGGDHLISIIDGIQANLFGMCLEKLLCAEMNSVSGFHFRKTCVVGSVEILKSKAMVSQYASKWGPLLKSVVAVAESISDINFEAEKSQRIIDDEDEDQLIQTEYSKLSATGAQKWDPFPNITNVQQHLVTSIKTIDAATLNQLLGAGLPGPECQELAAKLQIAT
eukprot:Clim_evm26s221 gene=Clim_evmTU26s221